MRDVATGGLKWTFAGDGQLSSPPAIADGYVYVSSDENLYAVDVSTHLPSTKNPLEGGCWRVVDRGQPSRDCGTEEQTADGVRAVQITLNRTKVGRR
ncbi:MAG TPA: PQQ-binding-like beta-propeller repeat protein [Polyangiaceae bacterium]|nr:PQQ-binding-like beta-propeller repeat protein [Polyangiaceae bacterium]